MHITCVVGARPNFMKAAPILEAGGQIDGLELKLVHTGQHYDERMSDLFFRQLGMPEPDSHLGVGGGNHAIQTARVMEAFDNYIESFPTDLVLVVGDVTSTLACALVAVKRSIPVAHVEAGLRSGDRSMPEEINRVLTDRISDYLFVTERSAIDNLKQEGISGDHVHFVGNVMIDSLLKHRNRARQSTILNDLQMVPRHYAVCTLHRPSNVDSLEAARVTVEALKVVSDRLPVIFPLHPRTRLRLHDFGLLGALEKDAAIRLVEPLGYLEFLALMDNASVVFTDSGGIQEETTVLGVPCITFRENTERPVTITSGTNQLVGQSPDRLRTALDEVLRRIRTPEVNVPELWDGKAAARIVSILTRVDSGLMPCLN